MNLSYLQTLKYTQSSTGVFHENLCILTDIQTYKHTDIQTYRQTDIQTYRHTDIQTYRHTDINFNCYELIVNLTRITGCLLVDLGTKLNLFLQRVSRREINYIINNCGLVGNVENLVFLQNFIKIYSYVNQCLGIEYVHIRRYVLMIQFFFSFPHYFCLNL